MLQWRTCVMLFSTVLINQAEVVLCHLTMRDSGHDGTYKMLRLRTFQ